MLFIAHLFGETGHEAIQQGYKPDTSKDGFLFDGRKGHCASDGFQLGIIDDRILLSVETGAQRGNLTWNSELLNERIMGVFLPVHGADSMRF